MTISVRSAGWKAIFAINAICYTNVPTTLIALTRQRLRWERDAVRLRYRRHIDLMNPFTREFKPIELLHELEFLAFEILATIAFPFYLIWLIATYGEFAIAILLAAQLGMVVLDTLSFVLSALIMPRVSSIWLLPYMAGYSVFYDLVMRFIRLTAYLQEWVFDASYRDPFVPKKVQLARR